MAQANPNILNPGQNDPLAQLRDIHMPAPIDAWPPAFGWWLLAALVLLALVALGLWLRDRLRKSRYRREALRALDQLLDQFEENGDSRDYLNNYANLLKLTALTRYPRDRVASLTGEAWVKFLDESANTKEFSMGAGQVLVQANYDPGDPDVDVRELHELARLWIENHRDLPVIEEAA